MISWSVGEDRGQIPQLRPLGDTETILPSPSTAPRVEIRALGSQGEGKGNMGVIHICRPNNPRFIARVRRPGYRTYERVGPERKTVGQAQMDLAKAFNCDKHHRGDVLMVTHDWYDPVQIVEIMRK